MLLGGDLGLLLHSPIAGVRYLTSRGCSRSASTARLSRWWGSTPVAHSHGSGPTAERLIRCVACACACAAWLDLGPAAANLVPERTQSRVASLARPTRAPRRVISCDTPPPPPLPPLVQLLVDGNVRQVEWGTFVLSNEGQDARGRLAVDAVHARQEVVKEDLLASAIVLDVLRRVRHDPEHKIVSLGAGAQRCVGQIGPLPSPALRPVHDPGDHLSVKKPNHLLSC